MTSRFKVWENQPDDNHLWAFFYYLKRNGHNPEVKRNIDGTYDLRIPVEE